MTRKIPCAQGSVDDEGDEVGDAERPSPRTASGDHRRGLPDRVRCACTTTNATSSATPKATMGHARTPSASISMRGSDHQPEPDRGQRSPARSNWEIRGGSDVRLPGRSGSACRASHTTATARGTLMRKASRQPKGNASTNAPPTNGPKAVNTPDSPDQVRSPARGHRR